MYPMFCKFPSEHASMYIFNLAQKSTEHEVLLRVT